MDLFVEKPINRSKLECILDQLQGQLSLPSSECSISEPLETSTTTQEAISASCPVTNFTVSLAFHPSKGSFSGPLERAASCQGNDLQSRYNIF